MIRQSSIGIRGACARAQVRGQRGMVFYLFVMLLLLTATALTGLAHQALNRHQDRTLRDQRALEQARDLLISHIAQPRLQSVTTRLGELTWLPDLPRNTGTGVDAVEPGYDGLAEVGLCARRTWNPGQAMAPVATSGANARCFGRLPWQQLGLPVSTSAADDPAGELPWVIVSPNLAVGATCLPNLNPMMLGAAFTGYACPGEQPFPWIQVLDARGNLLSDRVALALVMPGPALPGQTRTATAGPAAWLDRATVRADCGQPCRPGTYDNANYRHANNQPWVLINAASDGPLVERDTLYANPHHFNDRVLFVTIDELFDNLGSRAWAELDAVLREFRATQGHFPYAAALSDATGACSNGLRFGHPPSSDGSCGVGGAPVLPTWLTAAGWQHWFIYAVSARCNPANGACNAPGLVVDSRNDVNALLVAPGAPIRQPPFAAARGSAQTPINSGVLSSLPADWLDSLPNAGGLDVFVTTTPGTSPDNDRLTIVR